MILAGDVGGTKTVLAMFQTRSDGGVTLVHERIYASGAYPDFDDLLVDFLDDVSDLPSTVCLGVAGPVFEQRCEATNLPWAIEAKHLSRRHGLGDVRLLNDLEAMALGMLHLDEAESIALNPGAESRSGNRAVIAAGTGLGEAVLVFDGTGYRPMATEGGHADLAAVDAQQDEVLNYLRRRFNGHVSYERILSGNGFGYLYDFLVDSGYGPRCDEVELAHAARGLDRNAVISRLGLEAADPVCAEALRLFITFYGQEAGNLAMRSLARGGVFIGGGIAPKIQAHLADGTFLNAFTNKGRFHDMLSKVPITLALDPRIPLRGCAHFLSLRA